MSAPRPADEKQRLEALHQYAILDTAPESAYDELTVLAAHICDTPIALVSLVDEARQWFKSRLGLDASETHRDLAFCAHAILDKEHVLEVPDALDDPRFAGNALVTDEPRIRFYAGMPLVDHAGHALGTLCVIDRQPRVLRASQKQALQVLGRHVTHLIETRLLIAARQRAEASLRHVQQQQQRVLEAIGEGLHGIDRSGRIIYENPAAVRLLGYDSAEGLLGRPAHEAMHHSHADGSPYPADACPIYATLHDGITRRVESEFFWRKDGSGFEVTYVCTAVRDEAGDIDSVILVFRDITERKRRQRALEQFKKTLDQTVDCVFICRADDFRFVYVNEGAKRMVGYSEGELYAMVVPDINPEYSPASYRQLVQPLLDGKQASLTFETIHQHKDGHPIPVEVSTQVVRLQGVEPRLISVVRDITERQRAQQMLQSKNAELKTFSYTVSHDLKAPLRGITGYAQELERKHKAALPERAQYCVTQIVTASKNLDRLIEDLLQYSRVDSDQPSMAEVRIAELLQSILRDRSHTFSKLGIELSLDVSSASLFTWERGLHQVLTNLIDNAVKYSAKSTPPRLTIRVDELPNGCRIIVADNGIGFDMKYAERIFGLFNRLVRPDEFEGTGAGLAIVKKLLEKLGGSIRAESAPGQGATFYVDLPSATSRATDA